MFWTAADLEDKLQASSVISTSIARTRAWKDGCQNQVKKKSDIKLRLVPVEAALSRTLSDTYGPVIFRNSPPTGSRSKISVQLRDNLEVVLSGFSGVSDTNEAI
jgi:hypothetical protein